MFNHIFQHVYKVMCMVVQLLYRSNVQSIPYIHILWAPYMHQINSALSSSMAGDYFLACSIPIHLDLVGSALVSMIGPKQTLLDTQFWKGVALRNLVYEVSSWVVSHIEQKAVICIYLIHTWLMLHDTLNRQISLRYSFHFR